MKSIFALMSLSAVLVACATEPVSSEAAAWERCQRHVDDAARSSCITKALSDASIDKRAAEQAVQQDFENGASAIENKAAIEQALGVPTSKTGTTIVREPAE